MYTYMYTYKSFPSVWSLAQVFVLSTKWAPGFVEHAFCGCYRLLPILGSPK